MFAKIKLPVCRILNFCFLSAFCKFFVSEISHNQQVSFFASDVLIIPNLSPYDPTNCYPRDILELSP